LSSHNSQTALESLTAPCFPFMLSPSVRTPLTTVVGSFLILYPPHVHFFWFR
jgi:hypothetical protein